MLGEHGSNSRWALAIEYDRSALPADRGIKGATLGKAPLDHHPDTEGVF